MSDDIDDLLDESFDGDSGSFIRSTESPPLKRYTVIWTRRFEGKEYIDPIWHVDAYDDEHALVLAAETDRPANELTVKEEP